MHEEHAIVVEHLTKSFGKVEVLKDVSFSVAKGSMLALLGPNGAGKTTTVRILSTLLQPDGGSVSIEGFDVVRNAREVRHHIGLTGQYAAVDEYLTGRENLIMMGELYHVGKEKSTHKANELLKRFDLTEAADRAAKTYSGGMKRRLDLALSLVAAPPVLFLDEPTTGLDPRSRIAMWEVIGELMADGATILLTTQYLEEADKLADRIAVMDHGRIIAEGTADELKAKVGSDQLELTFTTDADFRGALTLFGTVAKSDQGYRTIHLLIDNPAQDVTRILGKLETAKVSVASLAIHKPTLDDVFLQLTGQPSEKQEIM